jgi:hypothetical protein
MKDTFESRINTAPVESILHEIPNYITILQTYLKKEFKDRKIDDQQENIRQTLVTYQQIQKLLSETPRAQNAKQLELIEQCIKSYEEMRPRFDAIVNEQNNEIH